MDVTQIYDIANDATKEAIGESVLLQKDLGNIVDVGTTVFNTGAKDKYINALMNRIGKTVFVNRPYASLLPNVMRDGWEFGSVLQKVRTKKLITAQENESWELEDGETYDTQVFYSPNGSSTRAGMGIDAKFFNSKRTFEIPCSFTERQLKQSFVNASELSAFISMIYTNIENSFVVKLDELVMRTIDNFIACTIKQEAGSTAVGDRSGVRAVNVLKLFKDEHASSTLTAATCYKDPEFARFLVYKMGLDSEHMTRMSTLFNQEGAARFTSKENQRCIMLADVEKAAKVYLYDGANQYNTENLALIPHDTVPYWQGSGTSYAFADCSKIKCTTTNDDAVEYGGILAVIMDKDAVAVCNNDKRVTSAYNAKGEFTNNYFKFDCEYLNDFGENGIVYYVADATASEAD